MSAGPAVPLPPWPFVAYRCATPFAPSSIVFTRWILAMLMTGARAGHIVNEGVSRRTADAFRCNVEQVRAGGCPRRHRPLTHSAGVPGVSAPRPRVLRGPGRRGMVLPQRGAAGAHQRGRRAVHGSPCPLLLGGARFCAGPRSPSISRRRRWGGEVCCPPPPPAPFLTPCVHPVNAGGRGRARRASVAPQDPA